jgi:exopolyphosphatase/guanosine-5'-triphosphate,3'-diphosphate pyrophosphatase
MNEKYAVIDIGSNSVRLMLLADGKVLYKTLNTTRLGEGIASSPSLQREAIERSAVAVAEFYERAKAEGAKTVCAFATAAVRSADNGMEFVERVRQLCPLHVDVISGEEEAEIGILGALGVRDGGIVDAGGASTEIIVQKGGNILYKKSVNIGVVRLKDMCGRDLSLLRSAAEKAASEYGKVPFGAPMYAIGGTATTLAAISLGLKKYDPNLVTGTKIAADEMRALADRLIKMPVEEIAALPSMPPKRADVIGGGAVLLSVLMDKLGFPSFIVSDSDNLEGYAIKHKLL